MPNVRNGVRRVRLGTTKRIQQSRGRRPSHVHCATRRRKCVGARTSVPCCTFASSWQTEEASRRASARMPNPTDNSGPFRSQHPTKSDVFEGIGTFIALQTIGKGRTSSVTPDSHRSRERMTWRFLDESEALVDRACCSPKAPAACSAFRVCLCD